MEPRLPQFLAVRDKWDPQRRLRSAQSRAHVRDDLNPGLDEGGHPRRNERHGSRARAAARRARRPVFLLGIDAGRSSTKSAADLDGARPAQRQVGHAICDLERPERLRGGARRRRRGARRVRHGDRHRGACSPRRRRSRPTSSSRAGSSTVNYAQHGRLLRARAQAPARARRRLAGRVLVGRGRPRAQAGRASTARARRGCRVYLEALDHKFHAAGPATCSA